MFGRVKLSGVYTAVVTPFDAKLNIDLHWMRQHLAFQQKCGIDGVVLCGTNGEGQSLSPSERRKLVDFVMKHRGDLKVIVSTGTSSLTETVEFTKFCRRARVTAALILPPYFDHHASTRGVAEYFRLVADRTRIPIILYNIPQYTGIDISIDMLSSLARHKRIVGVKDSAGDPESTRKRIKEFSKLDILCGTDVNIRQSLEDGASGVISGLANVFPQQVVELWKTFHSRGDTEKAQRVVSTLCSVFEGLPSRAATKFALHQTGMPATFVRPPNEELTSDQKNILIRRLSP